MFFGPQVCSLVTVLDSGRWLRSVLIKTGFRLDTHSSIGYFHSHPYFKHLWLVEAYLVWCKEVMHIGKLALFFCLMLQSFFSPLQFAGIASPFNCIANLNRHFRKLAKENAKFCTFPSTAVMQLLESAVIRRKKNKRGKFNGKQWQRANFEPLL